MANHLFIGLGGTGGKILRELRKRVYEEFGSNDPGHNIHLEYIYVDSSDSDLNDRTGWKVMASNVHLGEAQKVSIHGICSSMFQNINMYPGMKAFLKPDDINIMKNEVGPLVTDGIGGQRRRLGRTLMANNLSDKSNSQNFCSVLANTVNRLTNESQERNVTFHICAGLAGGTGSGSIVDVISQIRKAYEYQPGTSSTDYNGKKSGTYKMDLVLYVPEVNLENIKYDAGFYQANGYAALQELNAISIGKYNPLDVTGDIDVFTGKVKRLLNGKAFQVAYVYTNVNEDNRKLDLGKGLPKVVANFLFQNNIANAISGNSAGLSRIENCENTGLGPESNMAGEKVRSRNFMSFGIQRIEFPENEIREYMCYTYACQTVRQMLYNKWTENAGFDVIDSLDDINDINIESKKDDLLLSDGHLMLETPIIEGDRGWNNIEKTWKLRTQGFADETLEKAEKKEWLNKFGESTEEYYLKNYRGLGVKEFYKHQRNDKKKYARYIRKKVEEYLIQQWQVQQMGILQIEKFARLLIVDCNERLEYFKNTFIVRIRQEVEKYESRSMEISNEFSHISWLRDAITGASNKLFSRYSSARQYYYKCQTQILASEYAVELLQEIIPELNSMLDSIVNFKNELVNILDVMEREATSRCNKDDLQNEVIIKIYNPEKIHEIAHTYATNGDRQKLNSALIRDEMVKRLDDELRFTEFLQKVNYDEATNIVLGICKSNAEDAMNETANDDPSVRMVNVNILEKLHFAYPTDDSLEVFIKDIQRAVSPFVQFNQDEKSKVIGQENGAMSSMIQLSIPNAEENTPEYEFRKRFIKKCKETFKGVAFDGSTNDVCENYKSNQIVVISVHSGFPLRYIYNLKTLKEKYDTLLAAPQGDVNRMLLHTESFIEPLPSLFEMDSLELRKEMERPLLLAYTLGLIAMQTNPTTGEHFEALRIPDHITGGDTWSPLGKNFLSSLDLLSNDFKLSTILKGRVADELKIQAKSNDQKSALKKKFGEVLRENILVNVCEGNQFDERFSHYRNIGASIFNNELKEL